MCFADNRKNKRHFAPYECFGKHSAPASNTNCFYICSDDDSSGKCLTHNGYRHDNGLIIIIIMTTTTTKTIMIMIIKIIIIRGGGRRRRIQMILFIYLFNLFISFHRVDSPFSKADFQRGPQYKI